MAKQEPFSLSRYVEPITYDSDYGELSGVADALPLPDNDPNAIVLQMSTMNPLLTCQLCFGYFIDATAIIECTHTFCRSCIVQYFKNGMKTCPICGILIHEVDPISRLRLDRTLQDIVYKIIPDVWSEELKRRRAHERDHENERPSSSSLSTPTPSSLPGSDKNNAKSLAKNEPPKKRRGKLATSMNPSIKAEKKERALSAAFCAGEYVTICLKCLTLSSSSSNSRLSSSLSTSSSKPSSSSCSSSNSSNNNDLEPLVADIWLRCPVLMTLGHLKKFLSLKLAPKPLTSSSSTNVTDNDLALQINDITISTANDCETLEPSPSLLDSTTLKCVYLDQLCSSPDDPILRLFWKVTTENQH